MKCFRNSVLVNKGEKMKKIVLVTGATGGIGKAICESFAREGYDVALHYNSNETAAKELAESLATDYSVKVTPVKADLRNASEVKALAEKVFDIFGGVDVLVNNAGVAYQSVFQLADDEKVKELFEINLMSAMNLTKHILGNMISKKQGRIINISSMWGVMGASCEVHYSAAKSALIGFTKALAKEVGPSGITVNCVAPGFIDTKMNENIDDVAVNEIVEATPMGRKGKGEDVANLVQFLAGESASFITGQVISVDGGFAG